MRAFTVCYDKFCLGNFTIPCEDGGVMLNSEELGRFENYVLGMWNDGLVVTMKWFDEGRGAMCFFLLLPDASEQLMVYTETGGFVIEPYCEAGKGRMSYLLDFNKGLIYKGIKGYDEYDEEEKMFLGIVEVGERSLTYCGRTVAETQEDFKRMVDAHLRS